MRPAGGLAIHDIAITNIVYGLWHTKERSVGGVYCGMAAP